MVLRFIIQSCTYVLCYGTTYLITSVMYFKSIMILGKKKGDSILNGLLQTCRVIYSILSDAEYQLMSLTIDPKNLAQLEKFTRKADYSGESEAEYIWNEIYILKVHGMRCFRLSYFFTFMGKIKNRQRLLGINDD